VKNSVANDTRCVTFELGIEYEASSELAWEIIIDEANKMEDVLAESVFPTVPHDE